MISLATCNKSYDTTDPVKLVNMYAKANDEIADKHDEFTGTECSEILYRVYSFRALLCGVKNIKGGYHESLVEVFAHAVGFVQLRKGQDRSTTESFAASSSSVNMRCACLWPLASSDTADPAHVPTNHLQGTEKLYFPLSKWTADDPCERSLNNWGKSCFHYE